MNVKVKCIVLSFCADGVERYHSIFFHVKNCRLHYPQCSVLQTNSSVRDLGVAKLVVSSDLTYTDSGDIT